MFTGAPWKRNSLGTNKNQIWHEYLVGIGDQLVNLTFWSEKKLRFRDALVCTNYPYMDKQVDSTAYQILIVTISQSHSWDAGRGNKVIGFTIFRWILSAFATNFPLRQRMVNFALNFHDHIWIKKIYTLSPAYTHLATISMCVLWYVNYNCCKMGVW